MDVRNCKSCGRLFNYESGAPICEKCKRELEDKFQEIKTFLGEHPNTAVNQISEDFEVPIKQITQWIREERLVLSGDPAFFIECENCRAPIRTGRFCDSCKTKLQNQLSSAIDQPKKQEEETKKLKWEKGKMRFLDT